MIDLQENKYIELNWKIKIRNYENKQKVMDETIEEPRLGDNIALN